PLNPACAATRQPAVRRKWQNWRLVSRSAWLFSSKRARWFASIRKPAKSPAARDGLCTVGAVYDRPSFAEDSKYVESKRETGGHRPPPQPDNQILLFGI